MGDMQEVGESTSSTHKFVKKDEPLDQQDKASRDSLEIMAEGRSIREEALS